MMTLSKEGNAHMVGGSEVWQHLGWEYAVLVTRDQGSVLAFDGSLIFRSVVVAFARAGTFTMVPLQSL